MYVNKLTSVAVNRKAYNNMREKKRASERARDRQTDRDRARERDRQTDGQADIQRERGWILFCFLLSRYK